VRLDEGCGPGLEFRVLSRVRDHGGRFETARLVVERKAFGKLNASTYQMIGALAARHRPVSAGARMRRMGLGDQVI
jgi:hypothetical protein